MPGQPRDSYDTVVRKLADLDRRMEIAERHRHPTGRNSSGGGFEASYAYFERGSTQSIPNAGAGDLITLDAVGNQVGQPIVELAGAGDLRILLNGLYTIRYSGIFPSITANGTFEMYTTGLAGDTVSVIGVGTDWRVTTSSVTTRAITQRVNHFGCDAGTVLQFGFRQTSGSARNVLFQGTIVRLAANDEGWIG